MTPADKKRYNEEQAQRLPRVRAAELEDLVVVVLRLWGERRYLFSYESGSTADKQAVRLVDDAAERLRKALER